MQGQVEKVLAVPLTLVQEQMVCLGQEIETQEKTAVSKDRRTVTDLCGKLSELGNKLIGWRLCGTVVLVEAHCARLHLASISLRYASRPGLPRRATNSD